MLVDAATAVQRLEAITIAGVIVKSALFVMGNFFLAIVSCGFNIYNLAVCKLCAKHLHIGLKCGILSHIVERDDVYGSNC